MSERDGDADEPMPAHAEIADVVAKDDARCASRIDGREQESADQHLRPARLADDRRTKLIKLTAKSLSPCRHRVTAEIGATGDHDARRLPGGVRVDDLDAMVNHPAVHFFSSTRTCVLRLKVMPSTSNSISPYNTRWPSAGISTRPTTSLPLILASWLFHVLLRKSRFSASATQTRAFLGAGSHITVSRALPPVSSCFQVRVGILWPWIWQRAKAHIVLRARLRIRSSGPSFRSCPAFGTISTQRGDFRSSQ